MDVCVLLGAFKTVGAFTAPGRRKRTLALAPVGVMDETAPLIPSTDGDKYKINEVVPTESIEFLLYRHIEVATEGGGELQLTKGAMDFGGLAASMSLDEETKAHGGDAG